MDSNPPSNPIRDRWIRGDPADVMPGVPGSIRTRTLIWWWLKGCFGWRRPFNYLAFLQEMDRMDIPSIATREDGMDPERYRQLLCEYMGMDIKFVDVPASEEDVRSYQLTGKVPVQQKLYSRDNDAVFVMVSESTRRQDEWMSLTSRRISEHLAPTEQGEALSKKFLSQPHRYNQAAFEELSRIAAGHPIAEGDTMIEDTSEESGLTYGRVVDFWSPSKEARPCVLDLPELVPEDQQAEVFGKEVYLRS